MAFSRKSPLPATDKRLKLRLAANNSGTSECARRLGQRLQTTLNLESLMRLFSREVAELVPHSSLIFQNRRRDLSVSCGREARHSCSIHLLLESQELGELRFTRGREFEAGEITSMQQLVATLFYPLRNALQYYDAVQASLTDPLTGIHNRKFLDTMLVREIGLARRNKTPLSLVMLDVDRFKAINDENGHETGDRVIRQLTDAIGRGLRETDAFARYGGDEFTVLLANTSRRGALVVARGIAERVSALRIDAADRTLQPSVSIGVASLLSRDQPSRFVSRADAALYCAKNQGPGQVGIATSRGQYAVTPERLPTGRRDR